MFENKQKKMISMILANHGFKNQLIKTVLKQFQKERKKELMNGLKRTTSRKEYGDEKI